MEVSDADVIAYADAMLAENVRKAGSKETLEAIMHKSYAQIRQRYIQQNARTATNGRSAQKANKQH